MTEEELLDALRAGVGRTRSFMAKLTDYHGGPINTEYLLVGDLAREFLARQNHVAVESLNRSFCGVLASANVAEARNILRGKRTDIAVGDRLAPEALIEVKIRISRYSGIAKDLRKISDTIDFMKPVRQRSILGASVFQMHVKPTLRRWRTKHFVSAVRSFEDRLNTDLRLHHSRYPNYAFTLHHLMADDVDGIVDQTIEEDFDGAPMLGEKGHATRYYAIIMRHVSWRSQ